MLSIGIDLGCSFHKIVVLEAKKILHAEVIEPENIQRIDRHLLTSWYPPLADSEIRLFITGGRSKFIDVDASIVTERIDEIAAIAAGCQYFSPLLKRLLCISLGTGTCIVGSQLKHYQHLGGSGLGGGTLNGCARYLFPQSLQPVQTLFEFASRGESAKVDITVGEIIGSGIGIVPAHATASHLGQLTAKSATEDIAWGLVNLVATEITNLAVFCAKSQSFNHIVFIGYPIQHPLVSSIIIERLKMVAPEIVPIFPNRPVFGSALGAVHFRQLNSL